MELNKGLLSGGAMGWREAWAAWSAGGLRIPHTAWEFGGKGEYPHISEGGVEWVGYWEFWGLIKAGPEGPPLFRTREEGFAFKVRGGG